MDYGEAGDDNLYGWADDDSFDGGDGTDFTAAFGSDWEEEVSIET